MTEDPSLLTDADWAVINAILKEQGRSQKALEHAFMKLAVENPECYSRLLAANPAKVREALRNANAELGFEDDDIREMIRDNESPSKESH